VAGTAQAFVPLEHRLDFVCSRQFVPGVGGHHEEDELRDFLLQAIDSK
jgi:hypothetical protein